MTLGSPWVVRVAWFALGVAATIGVLGYLEGWWGQSRDPRADGQAIEVLKRARGFIEAKKGEELPDELEPPEELPDEADHVLVIQGAVPFEGPAPVVEARCPDPALEIAPDRPSLQIAAPNWTLRPGDLALRDLDVRTVRVDDVPLVRASGVLVARTPSGLVERPFESKDLGLTAWVHEDAVRGTPWLMQGAAGFSTDPGIELLGTFTKRGKMRGWYGRVGYDFDHQEYQIAAGITVRFNN